MEWVKFLVKTMTTKGNASRGTRPVCLLLFMLGVVLLVPPAVFGAEPAFPGNGFVKGWKAKGQIREFNDSGLYAYINGGSELFLEYGFKNLKLRTYRHLTGSTEISLEVYRMESPLAALGIYLLKCGVEKPLPGMDPSIRCTGDPFQVTLLKGRYFVVVNNSSGKSEFMQVMVELAGRFLEQVPAVKPVDLFCLLPDDGRVPGSGVLFCGPYSFESIYTLGEGDVLSLGNKIYGVAAQYVYKKKKPAPDSKQLFYHWIVVRYPDKEGARKAFAHLKANLDSYIKVISQNDTEVVFKDYREKFGKIYLKGEKLQIAVNLPELE
ncbi:MAG: hypothetical protein GY757_07510 [bacterium]|nr:hypothetical protein [bacterium]